MRVVYRGTIDEALETDFGGRHWIANEPQEALSPEDSAKQKADGWYVEEATEVINPDGRRTLVTERRWLSLVEAAKRNCSFDVEGEDTKVMKKRPKPERYPNAANEAGGDIWIGANG
jgi:hypothetical protein